ncbi:MAG: hypothetical protein ACYCZN_10980 [Candidatus Dormibacteria bacterium]
MTDRLAKSMAAKQIPKRTDPSSSDEAGTVEIVPLLSSATYAARVFWTGSRAGDPDDLGGTTVLTEAAWAAHRRGTPTPGAIANVLSGQALGQGADDMCCPAPEVHSAAVAAGEPVYLGHRVSGRMVWAQTFPSDPGRSADRATALHLPADH